MADSERSGSVPVTRRRPHKSQRRRDGLIQFAYDRTSQNGEDGIIRKIFQDVLPLPPPDESGVGGVRFCCDVGAWDGRHLSNTFSLLVGVETADGDHLDHQPSSQTKSPWRGLLIEADPNKFRDLETLHQPLGNICVNATVSGDPSSEDSLVSIIRNSVEKFPLDFDFLCIDVDGSDYWLLDQVFDSEFRPKVICVEANPTMPHDLIYIPARDDSIRHGASLAALVELAESKDYVLVETTIYNAFFVPKTLYDQYFEQLVPDTSIEALHEMTMGTSLYQLYDGTIKLWGCKKLLWHRIAMDEAKMQLLSHSQRNFPFSPSRESPRSDLEKQIAESAVDMSSYCAKLVADFSSSEGPTASGTMASSIPSSEQVECSRKVCSSGLLRQLHSDGFALVHGTGIAGQLCRQALHVTHSFLQEADESVRRSCLSTNDRARRGYSPMNTENFASLIGQEGPNDLVRKFRMGPPSTITSSSQSTNNSDIPDPTTPATSAQSSSLLRPNVWPVPSNDQWDAQLCHDFQSTLEAYYDQICAAANAIVRALCDGLISEHPALAPSLLEAFSSIQDEDDHQNLAHTSILTLLGYRAGTRHKKTQKKRLVHPLVAAHTDVGVITVLLYDAGDCAVLQRKAPNEDTDNFEDVILPSRVPDDPIFVVNVADCFSALTRNYLPSTIHRVMPQGGSVPRNCLALFVGLDPEQNLTFDDEQVSYEVWRRNRIAESQRVLRSK